MAGLTNTLDDWRYPFRLHFDGINQEYSLRMIRHMDALPDPGQNLKWNWTLEGIKRYAEKYKSVRQTLAVGKLYTGSGIKVVMSTDSTSTACELKYCLNGSAVIDWGDGTTTSVTGTSTTSRKTTSHTYNATGNYTINISITGSFIVGGGYASSIAYPFINYCQPLEIYIGEGATGINKYAFDTLYSQYIRRFYLSESVTSIGMYAFYTTITTSDFGSLYLETLALPSSITTLENEIEVQSETLKYISFPETMDLTMAGTSGNALPVQTSTRGKKILSLCFPENIEGLRLKFTLAYLEGLKALVIPENVEWIGSNNITGTLKFKYLYFMSQTPPELVSTSVFRTLASDIEIHVPKGCLAAYSSAQYYPSASTYKYIADL